MNSTPMVLTAGVRQNGRDSSLGCDGDGVHHRRRTGFPHPRDRSTSADVETGRAEIRTAAYSGEGALTRCLRLNVQFESGRFGADKSLPPFSCRDLASPAGREHQVGPNRLWFRSRHSPEGSSNPIPATIASVRPYLHFA